MEAVLKAMLAQRADLFTLDAETVNPSGDTRKAYTAATAAVPCRLWQPRGAVAALGFGDRIEAEWRAIFDTDVVVPVEGRAVVDGATYDIVFVERAFSELGVHHQKVTLRRATVAPFV